MDDKELAAIDIGSWKSPAFSAERAPRLAEVLARCKRRAEKLLLDLAGILGRKPPTPAQ